MLLSAADAADMMAEFDQYDINRGKSSLTTIPPYRSLPNHPVWTHRYRPTHSPIHPPSLSHTHTHTLNIALCFVYLAVLQNMH